MIGRLKLPRFPYLGAFESRSPAVTPGGLFVVAFWKGILLAAIILVMGRGRLQHDILAVLDKRHDWSRPKDILSALNRQPTASNRAGVSRVLKALWERGLIDSARALRCLQIVLVQSAAAALRPAC